MAEIKLYDPNTRSEHISIVNVEKTANDDALKKVCGYLKIKNEKDFQKVKEYSLLYEILHPATAFIICERIEKEIQNDKEMIKRIVPLPHEL